MDLKYFILSLLLFVGCGRPYVPDTEIEPNVRLIQEKMPWAFDENNPDITYIYLWELHWFVYGKTITYEDKHIEIQIEKLAKDSLYVYIHEIGHAMGLEHSEDVASIMYKEAKVRSLEQAILDLEKECIVGCKPLNVIIGKPY